MTSRVVPVARAPASKQRITRSRMISKSATVAPRTMYSASVWAGTMLGASPPCVTMPWTRSPAWMCWRSRPMATRAADLASMAMTLSLRRRVDGHDRLDGPGEGVGAQFGEGGVVGAHGVGQFPGEPEADVAVLGVDDERLDAGGGDLAGGAEGGGD